MMKRAAGRSFYEAPSTYCLCRRCRTIEKNDDVLLKAKEFTKRQEESGHREERKSRRKLDEDDREGSRKLKAQGGPE
jgi:hypothetical protein